MPVAEPARPAGRLRRLLRAALFACLPLLVLLAVLELVLRLFSWGLPSDQLSLARGFDHRVPYLVPDEEHPGGWRTQIFDELKDEVHIPPRDGRTRVLLLGGSNTRLFPAEDLAAQLDAARPGVVHEVVNLGRPGYGSERALILLQQALETLQPDVIVMYCGHNEFVEAGFAAELAREWDRPWFLELATQARRLRTVNLLVDLARASVEPPPAGARPELRADRPGMMDLRYEQTLVFYDVYRANLRAMCEAAQRHGTAMVLCTVVGNMLAPPVVSRHLKELDLSDTREFNRLRTLCLATLPARLVRGIIGLGPGDPPARLHWSTWGEHLLAADRYARAARDERPVPVLRRLLPPLDDVGPLWADPALWEPPVRELLATVSAFLVRDLSPEERAAVGQALAAARQAVALSPGYALAVFELGLCLYLSGDTQEAVQCLRRAATLDCSPNRGNDITNAIVRDVAAEHPEVLLVDADVLFAQRSPDALVTYELVMDNCHLQFGARHVLMQDLVPAIGRLAGAAGR